MISSGDESNYTEKNTFKLTKSQTAKSSAAPRIKEAEAIPTSNSQKDTDTALVSNGFFEKRNRKGITSQQGPRIHHKPMFLNGIDPMKFISENPDLVDKQPYLGIYS